MGLLRGWQSQAALMAFAYDVFDPWFDFSRPSSLSTSGIQYPRLDASPQFGMPKSQKSLLEAIVTKVGLGNSRCCNVFAWRWSHSEMVSCFDGSMAFCSFQWRWTKGLPKILLSIYALSCQHTPLSWVDGWLNLPGCTSMSWSFAKCRTMSDVAKYVAKQRTTLHIHLEPSFAHGEFESWSTRKSTSTKGIKQWRYCIHLKWMDYWEKWGYCLHTIKLIVKCN